MGAAIRSGEEAGEPPRTAAPDPRGLIDAVARGDAGHVLRNRGSLVARAELTGRSVIVKLWSAHQKARRLSISGIRRSTWARREAKALRRLAEIGVRAPRVIAFHKIASPDHPYTHATILEDLGDGETGMQRIHRALQEHEEAGLRAFDDGLIDITARMVGARVLDTDFKLINVYVLASGEVCRLDLECAVCIPFAPLPLPPWIYGTMLGQLLGTYVFAVQPRVELAHAFADRLAERLRPSPRVRRTAQRCIDDLMDHQRRKRGIDTEAPLLR